MTTPANDGPSWDRSPASDAHATSATADEQLRDAELALRMARGCFEHWRATGPDALPAVALRHAYHTHEALHEASRLISTLIETFRAEVARPLVAPAPTHDRATSAWDRRPCPPVP